jgi:addiction module HigA family antidote
MKNRYNPQTVPHPGETLREKLEELGMGPKEFALRTGKPEKTITAVLHGDSSITPDMAIKFEIVTRIPAHFWMNNQRGYDEYIAREKQQIIIQEAIKWAQSFPIEDMHLLGWLPKPKTLHETAAEMLAFFGFANHHAWKDYYLKQQLKVAFRISLASTADPFALSVWLRKGELQGAELQAPTYEAATFKSVFPEILALMEQSSDHLFSDLQAVCLKAGVKVVYTPTLSDLPVIGSTRWMLDTPLIQLSVCDPADARFWFTFFHEAGHILLHGKKEIFLEKIEYTDMDPDKEGQADQFAMKWTAK